MLLHKAPVVFLALIATVFSCELSSVCDTECTTLENDIKTRAASVGTTYRQKYHVMPRVGWMNDPNGFIFYQNKYHIFYQYYPYDSKFGSANWGKIHWGHATSTDLVTWTNQITALIPGTESCFSGSAVVMDTTLVLMYTAHVESVNGTEESQYLAFSDDGIHFHKYANNPVLRFSTAGSANFRDPKAWKYGSYWYVVIGSKVNDLGQVRLYRSTDLVNWTFQRIISQSTNNTMGTMYECPDFFPLGNQFVLLMSPQGMDSNGDRYNNLYQTGYILGTFSYSTNIFTETASFQELDYGHDFYATQTTENGGKRYLSAWLGMWGETVADTQANFPEAEQGWAGTLTTFRELSLVGTRIHMYPVAALTKLRETSTPFETTLAKNTPLTFDKTGELIISSEWVNETVLMLTGTDGGGNITLTFDPSTNIVALYRDGDVRQVAWTTKSSKQWRILLDTSSIELFCGTGEVVFSSRFYPTGLWKVTNLGPLALTIEAYNLNSSVS